MVVSDCVHDIQYVWKKRDQIIFCNIFYKTFLDELKQQLRTKRAKLDHVVIAAAILHWHCQ